MCHRSVGVIWLLIFIGHLYLSGGWLRADVITETKKTCLKEIGLRAQKLLTILGSVVNIIWGERGGPMWPSNGSLSLYFDNSYQFEIRSKTY